MRAETAAYWRRIFVGNLVASALVLFVFGGITWGTPLAQFARAFGIAFLFSSVIGPLLGASMPRLAPWVWKRARFPFNWVAVSAAMTLLAVAGSIVAIAILVAARVVAPGDFGAWLRGSLRIAIAITLTIGLFITAYELMRARVAQASAQAQLASLESRVQPHFLFNTLNSIAALIHEDPHAAERMTGQLASLMRSSLDRQSTPLVSLDEELETVRDYLAIEQVRFGDRLRYTIDRGEAGSGARVPRLAIQTVVENSVKYAVSPRRQGAAIRIASDDARHRVRIMVEDDGPGFDAAILPAGHGLSLLRDRLALMFGDSARLDIDAAAAGGTRVTITVPHLHDVPAPFAPANRRAADCAQPAHDDRPAVK